MKKILDRSAFTQKLRIGRNVKFYVALAAVHREGSLQLFACPCRNRAFLDHKLWRGCMGSDRTRHVIDRAKIGVPIGQRRSSDADKDRISLCGGVSWVGTKAEPLLFSSGPNHFFK